MNGLQLAEEHRKNIWLIISEEMTIFLLRHLEDHQYLVSITVGASLVTRKTQDLILQDFSRKTLGARLARQIFTKKLYFSGQKWSIFTKLFK